MRNPMNVITRHITPDSASIRNARSTFSSPVAIQVVTTSVRPSGPASGSAAKKASIVTMHAAPIASAATMNTVSFDHFRPNSISSSAPTKGSSGIRRRSKVVMAAGPSALHQRGFIEIDGLAAAEQSDQDRQADRGLRRGEGDDQEREHVPLLVAELAREGEQREVAAVELELDAHQHDEGVAAQQDAGRPDQEQQERQNQVVLGRHG